MKHALFVYAFVTAVSPTVWAQPKILDTVGGEDTDVTARVYPTSPASWAPQVKLFVHYADYASEDVIQVQWLAGKKPLGKPLPCSATHFVREVQEDPTKPTFPANLALFECTFPQEAAIAKAGKFSLELTYKQPLLDKRTPLGLLHFDVIELAQGARNNPVKTFTELRDHRLGLAFIEEAAGVGTGRDRLPETMMRHHRIGWEREAPHLIIRFATKFDSHGPRTLSMTCLRGTEKIGEGSFAGAKNARSYWTFPKSKSEPQQNVETADPLFNFYRVKFKASPDYKGQRDGYYFLGENPGMYRCVAMGAGEIIAEVNFEIGRDGEVVKSPCTSQINTLRHVHLGKLTAKQISNVDYDKAAVTRSAFFGRVNWSGGCPNK